jgi:nucleotide-binding universal stress UspA family protein
MEKHLLVTISDDTSCLYGVRFVESFFEDKSAMRITLFYDALINDPKYHMEDFEQHAQARKVAETYRSKGQEALEASRKILCDRGFPQEHVDCKFIFKQFGTVKDIVREGKRGNYDAVVLGRRGYNLLESFLADSVSRKILDQDINFPIWICRFPEKGRKDVLLCVDGSKQSSHISDHVGFILENEKEHSVAILHVDTGHDMDVESILGEARKKLTENGVEQERINTRVIRSHRVVHTILEEVERGVYAAVAVGRVGIQKSRWKEWLVGSTTMKLLENLGRAVLWVSR